MVESDEIADEKKAGAAILARPDLTIDTITLVLVAIAAIPWLGHIIESFELPGGPKVTYRKLASGADVRVLPADPLQAVAEETRYATGASRVHSVLDARMDEVYAAAWAWQSGAWLSTGAATLGKPEQLVVGADMLMAGNAFVAYGGRLERPGSTQHFALPAASAMLRLAPALWAAGRAVPAAQAMPHYIRDKVAKTTAERLAEQAAMVSPGAPA